MFERLLPKLLLGMLIATSVMGVVVSASVAHAKPAPKSLRVEGVLVDLNLAAGTVAIRVRTGDVVVVSVNGSTKIERNGVHTTLAAFRIGDRVQARLGSAESNLAIKFEGTGP